ncbi:Gram-positive signal peptide protein, YSIRK family [Streptococcus ictaluri 707-05]|uniref:Gram-positive signal peptide protein, YSIRK family n=1 Tax=Streptococcus ictaluri 707-05 TaxID=764299 RepID=G5JZQ7_9STRE|nr:Gram-positive signal peptide protein, YSIRK family [Streptococcus ictaluri 707-05]
MNKQVTQGSKTYKYAIKKLSIGVVSVATGASILLYSPQVLAQEGGQPQTAQASSQGFDGVEVDDTAAVLAILDHEGLNLSQPDFVSESANSLKSQSSSAESLPVNGEAPSKSPALAQEMLEEKQSNSEIEANHLRIHFKNLPQDQSPEA